MQIKNLTMSFGVQTLFENINLYINDKEKVGVVGVNGAGKSTFFKIIIGDVIPDNGSIIFKSGTRISYLPQVIDEEISSSKETVWEFLNKARPIEKLNKDLQIQYENLTLTDANISGIYKKIDNIEKKLAYWDSYEAESILLKIIKGMNVNDDLLLKNVNDLSGGEKSKIAFARLLYSKPEVILLDEPTNHLDAASKEYVINYLKNYKGTILVISHDIDFLNRVTSKTLLIDKRNKSFNLYDGNYDYFKKLSEEYEKNLIRQKEKQDEEEKKLREIINKYTGVSGKRKRMAQDREKKLEKLLENKIEISQDIKKTELNLVLNRESSNIPVRVNNVSFGYTEDEMIIKDLSFNLDKGEKFLIVGENGVGKSTLLKLIVGQLRPKAGNIEVGTKTDIGYYAQEHELLDNTKNILENFQDIDISINKLRNVLGRFLFYGDDVYKLVGYLSPGERSRVALAKLSLTGANFLILDEPTNHLDPETQKIVAHVFKNYLGTMLVVSHNPEFVDNLGIERMLLMPSGKIVYYDSKIVEKYYKINNDIKNESGQVN